LLLQQIGNIDTGADISAEVSSWSITRHALIGDVRGSGLFLGIDLVLDRETRAPAALQASYVVNSLRDCGILAGTDGPHHNVIKLRPPLVFSEADGELFLRTLDAILREDTAQPVR